MKKFISFALIAAMAVTTLVGCGNKGAKADGGSSDAAMPSENYNDILKEIQKTKAEAGQSQSYSENAGQTSGTGTSGQITQASGTGAAGNTGGGGDSDDETTTTKTVVINGVTYLETTTVENGVTSVQRTAISGVGEE